MNVGKCIKPESCRLTNTSIQTVLKRRTASSLVSLPPEILNEITAQLSYVDYVELSLTCKKLWLSMKSKVPPDKDTWYAVNSSGRRLFGREFIICFDERCWYFLCPGCSEFVGMSCFFDNDDPDSYLLCGNPEDITGKVHSFNHLNLTYNWVQIVFYCNNHGHSRYVGWSGICRQCQWRLSGRKKPVRSLREDIARFRTKAVKRLQRFWRVLIQGPAGAADLRTIISDGGY